MIVEREGKEIVLDFAAHWPPISHCCITSNPVLQTTCSSIGDAMFKCMDLE